MAANSLALLIFARCISSHMCQRLLARSTDTETTVDMGSEHPPSPQYADSDTSTCHFFRLPPELRDIVYSEVIKKQLEIRPRHFVKTAQQAFGSMPRFLRTCSAFWTEAGKIYSAGAIFVYTDIDAMIGFLEGIPQQHRQAVRTLHNASGGYTCGKKALRVMKGDYARLTEHALHRDIDISVMCVTGPWNDFSCGPDGEVITSPRRQLYIFRKICDLYQKPSIDSITSRPYSGQI